MSNTIEPLRDHHNGAESILCFIFSVKVFFPLAEQNKQNKKIRKIRDKNKGQAPINALSLLLSFMPLLLRPGQGQARQHMQAGPK